MNRKIINGIISLAIVIVAIFGLSRLRFIERSFWIFKTNNEQNSRRSHFERGIREGRDFRARPQDFRARDRSGFENQPDSINQRITAERGADFKNDSTRELRAQTFTGDGNDFRDRRPGNNGRRGHDFRRGNSVQLGNASWFLIVFAGFTVITIYLDLLMKWIKRKKY